MTPTVSLFNVSYEVPQQYIGRTIHLRYRPEDMSEIYIYIGECGKRLHTAEPVRKLENTKKKRRANISYGVMDGGGAILSDLKLLMNFEMDSRNYAVLVLCGQPTLNNTLSMQIHEAQM